MTFGPGAQQLTAAAVFLAGGIYLAHRARKQRESLAGVCVSKVGDDDQACGGDVPVEGNFIDGLLSWFDKVAAGASSGAAGQAQPINTVPKGEEQHPAEWWDDPPR